MRQAARPHIIVTVHSFLAEPSTDDPATLGKLKGQPAVLIVAPLSGHYATLLRVYGQYTHSKPRSIDTNPR